MSGSSAENKNCVSSFSRGYPLLRSGERGEGKRRGKMLEIVGMFFKIVYGYVFVLQLLAVSFSVVWVFYPLQKDFKSIAIAILHMAAVFAVGTVLNLGLFIISNYWRWLGGINFPIAWLLTVLVYLVFFCKIKVSCRIIMGATLYTTIVTVVEAASIFPSLLMHVYNADFDWLCILFDLFIIAFSVIMRRFTLEEYTDMAWVSVVMMLIASVMGVVIVFFEILEKINGTGVADAFLCLVLFGNYAFLVISYLMIYFHCQVRKEMTVLAVENKLLEADKQMLTISEHALEEIRSFRHDVNNQFHVMQLMIKEGKTEELSDYLRSMYASVVYSHLGVPYVNTGNDLLDSIINMEMIKAYSSGIQLTTRINVPEILNVEASDLCRILANIIDNAIEAILRSKLKERLIDCIMHTVNGYLYISVANSIAPGADRERTLSLVTSKTDRAHHGFGHRILKRIVGKYNGELNYKIEDEQFIVEIMLDLTARSGGRSS